MTYDRRCTQSVLAAKLDRALSSDPELQSLSEAPAVASQPQQTGRVAPVARPVPHEEERA